MLSHLCRKTGVICVRLYTREEQAGGAVAVPGTDYTMASVLTHGDPGLCHLQKIHVHGIFQKKNKKKQSAFFLFALPVKIDV
jgi:hypothetical protein